MQREPEDLLRRLSQQVPTEGGTLGRKSGRSLRKLADELVRLHPQLADPDMVIRQGMVLVDRRIVTNPASLVRTGASIRLRFPTPLRGAAKLRAALAEFRIDVSDRVALDIGAAAGGFTRVLLEAGATRVYAVDAGFGQLLGSLRQDPRVVTLERTNVGQLDTARVPDVVDVVTIDLSYLAVGRAAPQLTSLEIAPDADLVALVKPMFELGLARPPTARNELVRAVDQAQEGLERAGWRVVGAFESLETGARGAIEYLVHARRGSRVRPDARPPSGLGPGGSGPGARQIAHLRGIDHVGCRMRIPEALVRTWSHEGEWLSRLPRLADECAMQWGLALEEAIDTPHSLVVPAGDAVLKLNAPGHEEADREADALALWNGGGAVRLLERDDDRHALLIERCRPGTPLWDADVDATVVVAELLPRLQIEVVNGHPFTLLAEEADRWADEVPLRFEAAGRPFERRLLDAALDVYRTVDASASRLVNQDLHGGNVLRAEREPWLVVDPKPLVGERELDASGLLRNADSVSRWLDVLADLGLDRERARGWGVAHNLAWAWDERRGWLDRHVEEARRILNAR